MDKDLYENFNMKKIGIIGKGFVGSAVQFGFSPQTGCEAEVKVYDKDPLKSTHTLEETVNKSDFIFLSVPTPANKDGSMHIDILESALNDIQTVMKNNEIQITDKKLGTWLKDTFGAPRRTSNGRIYSIDNI